MENTRGKILVVEDDEDVISYLKTCLTDEGFITQVARDVDEAMEKVKASRPDLITLDIMMPKKTGIKFYREIRRMPDYSDIPIIIITGITQDFKTFIHRRRYVPPPDGYISKPFSKEELIETLNNIISQNAAATDRRAVQ